ncbi:MAG: hypothetical protein RL434_2544, partial [Pseudomonadota bacterium]
APGADASRPERRYRVVRTTRSELESGLDRVRGGRIREGRDRAEPSRDRILERSGSLVRHVVGGHLHATFRSSAQTMTSLPIA